MKKHMISKIIAIIVIITISVMPYVNAKVESIQVENGQYIDAIRITTNGTYNYDYANEVLRLVNEERAKENLKPLSMDKSIQDVAMLRSNECSIYYDHMRPNGLSCFTLKGDIFICGENIAIGYSTPESVVQGWMNSPGHRANIMNSSAKSIGVGCYEAEGALYWTQTFSPYDPAQKATTTGTQAVTKTHVVSASLNLLDLYIRGLGSTNNLNVGDTLAPTSIKNINVGWSYFSIGILSTDVEFTSSNQKVFTVDKNGTVTAVGPGEATLTAALGDSVLTYNMVVKAPLISISINKTNTDVRIGRTVKLSVIYNPTNTTDNKTVTWTSLDKNIATVDENGVVTGVNVGTTTITATVGDKSFTSTVRVTSAGEGMSMEYIKGDINCDGKINAQDASIVLDKYKYGNATEEDLVLGDMDNNSKLNANDVSMIIDIYKSN